MKENKITPPGRFIFGLPEGKEMASKNLLLMLSAEQGSRTPNSDSATEPRRE